MDKWTARICSRDEAAYIQLIEKYSRMMWRLAWDIMKGTACAADVEDCVADVFYKLWKSPELPDPEKGSVKAYLARMTKNAAIDFCRRRSRESAEPLCDTAGENGDVADAVIQLEEAEALRRVINTLSERDRELISRRYVLSQKPAQISEEMSLPVREVENRLYRIKKSIRKQML